MRTFTLAELYTMDFHFSKFFVYQTIKEPYVHFVCNNDTHKCDRFFYIANGEFQIKQKGCSELTLKKGDMIYLPRGTAYTAQWNSSEIEYYSIHFILGDNDGEFLLSNNIEFVLSDKHNIVSEMFTKMNSVWTSAVTGYKMKAFSYFFEFLNYICEKKYKYALKAASPDISDAILYIENNFLSEISVAELAKMCKMSESVFRRHFHNYAGMPPISYRNKLRIQKAAVILSGGEYTVSEVAELTGFWDLAHFNKTFKQYMGTSPGSYVKARR